MHVHLVYPITGLEVFRQCRDRNDDFTVALDECQTGHIINIESVTVGRLTNQDRSQCNLGGNATCRRPARIRKVDGKCNGRLHCNFNLHAYNRQCPENKKWRINFVEIGYNCINGTETCFMIRLFIIIIFGREPIATNIVTVSSNEYLMTVFVMIDIRLLKVCR